MMGRPLHFLHLTTFYPPYSFGGDATFLYRLCHALGDAGHQVDVIHCIDAYHVLHPAQPETAFADHPNVTVHGLRSGWKWLSPLLTQQTGRPMLKRRQIQQVLDRKPFDVVHYHNMSLLGPTALTLEPKAGRVIKMYTTHEHWLICPTHVLWKYQSRPCEKPQCLRCTLHAGRPPQWWRSTGLLEKCCRHVDQFVAPSCFTAAMHRQRGFKQPMEVLPHFSSAADHDWQQPGPPPHQRPYFLFVGRLEVIKGVHTLIDLWERFPDADLLVAGAGTQAEPLRARAAANPRIRFLGTLSQKELGRYYAHALACVVPSLTYETFGLVCIEAFARKTPVIVRDLGALPEVVHESQGGFVYRTDQELRDALQALAASPQMRAQLGENGYQAFLRHWTPNAHLKKYIALLDRISEEKFGRPLAAKFVKEPERAGAWTS
jgi:glycosyltransferase involved in cell wall biosynthesis